MSFLAEQFELLAEAQGGVPALRRLIVDVAMQGKLTSQNPNEESASVLVEKLLEFRQALSNYGKRKSEYMEDNGVEPLFDIPDNWKWVRLETLCEQIADIDHKMPKSVQMGVPFLSAKDLKDDGTLDFSNPKYISEEDFLRLSRKVLPKRNDIIYSRIGARLGKARLVEVDTRFLISYSCCLIRPIHKLVDKKFLLYFLDSHLALDQGQHGTKSIGVPDLGLGVIKNYAIPLPPLAEQGRIVERVESLLAQCDALETAQAARAEKRALFAAAAWSAVGNSDYEAWHSVRDHFPLVTTTPADVKLLREAILQLAVRGKLVAQNPDDEAADLLLARITAEKARLVAAGELKAGKPLPPITEEEIPYELPPGWMWVRAEEIFKSVQDGTHFSPKDQYVERREGYYLYLTSKNIRPFRLELNNVTYLDKHTHDSLYERCPTERGDVLLVKDGANTGTVAVNTLEEPFSLLSSVAMLKPLKGYVSAEYIQYALASPTILDLLLGKMTGSAIQRIILAKIRNLALPLPPLAEQARIVERVESLLAQCDALEVALAAREQTQAALAGAIAAG